MFTYLEFYGVYSLVIYWPSTEPSIKRYICVNKRKNSGSMWTLDNDITRCPDNSSKLETRCRSESQRQTEGFRPSVTHGWATPAKMKKKCCYGRKKNLGQYSSLSLSPAHLPHTTNITLSKMKCERLYFYKEVCSFVCWSHHYSWLCSAYICIMDIQHSSLFSFVIGFPLHVGRRIHVLF